MYYPMDGSSVISSRYDVASPFDEAAVLEMILALLTGQPSYVVRLLNTFSISDPSNGAPSLEITEVYLKRLYLKSRLPVRFILLFDVAVDIGLKIYKREGGPFQPEARQTAATLFLENFLDHRVPVSPGFWKRAVTLLLQRL